MEFCEMDGSVQQDCADVNSMDPVSPGTLSTVTCVTAPTVQRFTKLNLIQLNNSEVLNNPEKSTVPLEIEKFKYTSFLSIPSALVFYNSVYANCSFRTCANCIHEKYPFTIDMATVTKFGKILHKNIVQLTVAEHISIQLMVSKATLKEKKEAQKAKAQIHRKTANIPAKGTTHIQRSSTNEPDKTQRPATENSLPVCDKTGGEKGPLSTSHLDETWGRNQTKSSKYGSGNLARDHSGAVRGRQEGTGHSRVGQHVEAAVPVPDERKEGSQCSRGGHGGSELSAPSFSESIGCKTAPPTTSPVDEIWRRTETPGSKHGGNGPMGTRAGDGLESRKDSRPSHGGHPKGETFLAPQRTEAVVPLPEERQEGSQRPHGAHRGEEAPVPHRTEAVVSLPDGIPFLTQLRPRRDEPRHRQW